MKKTLIILFILGILVSGYFYYTSHEKIISNLSITIYQDVNGVKMSGDYNQAYDITTIIGNEGEVDINKKDFNSEFISLIGLISSICGLGVTILFNINNKSINKEI